MNEDRPESGDQVFMEFAAAAVQLKRLFDSYLSAGFTERQAIQLILGLMASQVQREVSW